MDSPLFDGIFVGVGAPNPIFLEEDKLILSQACLFLQDMMSEAMKNEEKNTNKSISRDPRKNKMKTGKEKTIDDYKKRAEVAEAAVKDLKITIDIYQNRVKKAELALEGWRKNIGTIIEGYQRRAENAEEALEELKTPISRLRWLRHQP
jgi:hypothetical protein